MDNGYDVVLVDYSWLLARQFHAFKKQNTSVMVGRERVYTGDAYGTLSSMSDLMRAAPGAKIILCIDWKTEEGNYANKAFFENYKATRVDGDREMFQKYDEVLALACMLDDVYAAGVYGAEADEVITALAGELSDGGRRVMMFAKDKDMCQAVSGTRVLKSCKVKKGKFVDPMDADGVVAKFGCPPESMPMYQAIVGDGVDDVVGYRGFYRKHAAAIASAFSNPESFHKRDPGDLPQTTETQAKKLDLWLEKLRANFVLTDMSRAVENLGEIELFKPAPRSDLVDVWRLSRFAAMLRAQDKTTASYEEIEL